MDLGQHHVGLAVGEIAAALDRRQLGRIAQHQDRLAEREQVARELRVDHRAFVDHDEAGARGRAVGVEGEGRRAFRALARAVDQRVDGGRAGAALRAHHQRRLAGEGGEGRVAARAFGDMAGERRLADAGIAEQAEHLRLALLEPAADRRRSRRVCSRRPFAADRARGRAAGVRRTAAPAASRGRAAWLPPPRPRASARPPRRSASRPAACGRDRSIWPRRPSIAAWFRAGRPPACSWSISPRPPAPRRPSIND